MISLRQLAPAAVLLLQTAFLLPADDWAQWRGPDRTGQVPADARVPSSLPSEPRVVWRIDSGPSLASPVVAGGKVFQADARDGKEVLRCLAATDGRELWHAVIDDPTKDNQGPSGPRCTPLVDGDRVYAQSCKGELKCLQVADGSVAWRINYKNDLGAVFIGERGNIPGAARHGNNGSPVIDGDHLIACAGGTNGAAIVCFDKRTGGIIWKSQNDMAGYAAPIIATIHGARQVVCFTVEGAVSVAADDGRLLWRVPLKTDYGRHATTPVIWEDMVVLGSHQAGLIGIKLSREGSDFRADVAWTNKEAAPNFSCPVAVGRHLYGLGPAKNLICVEIPTGKLAWSKEGFISTSTDKATAAFLVMGKNILVATDGGVLALIEANPAECKEISRAQVCGLTWTSPAYADGKLYHREGVKDAGHLLCLDLLDR